MVQHQPRSLTRVVRDLIADELARLRHADPALIARELKNDQRLGPDGFGMDSFEFMTVSAAFARMFHLYDLGAEDYLLARPTVDAWCDLVMELATSDSGDTASGPAHLITFLSSGSTGERTAAEHSRQLLVEEMQVFRKILGTPARLFVTVPAHHIYGYLFSVLLPDIMSESAAPEIVELRGAALSRPPAAYTRSGSPAPTAGDMIISFPDALARLNAAGTIPQDGLTIVTSTAPCPPELARRIRSGGSRLVEVYGSSETAGTGFRDSDDAPYTLLPYWDKRGDSLIRPAQGATGYHEVRPPDELSWWDDDRHFLPLRRRDGAVVVGGRNVYPDRVADAIRALEGVHDAAVRLHDAAGGSRLKAFVVAGTDAPDTEQLESRIRASLARTLTAAEQPAVYTFGPALPRNTMGKLSDWVV